MTTIPNDTLYVDTFSDFMCNTTLSEYVEGTAHTVLGNGYCGALGGRWLAESGHA